ncbi:MAG: hypothetical protein ACE5EN_02600 [Nitrospinota bacterium]
MNFRAALFVLSLVAISTVGSGTEVDIYNVRNPFEFAKKKAVIRVRRVPKEKKAETTVDLIMIKGSDKLAVINDKSYRIGDVFEGYPIISITLDYVELSSENGKKRLYLK